MITNAKMGGFGAKMGLFWKKVDATFKGEWYSQKLILKGFSIKINILRQYEPKNPR